MVRREQQGAVSQRRLRVGESLRHALSRIFQRSPFRDPDLAASSITVTEVRVSPDMGNATAFIMPLGGVDIGLVQAALKRAAPYIRGLLAAEVELRRLPRFRFEIDTAYDTSERIERLLLSDAVRPDLEGFAPEYLGPENLGPENLGPENLGPENLGPEYLGPGGLADEP